MNETQILNEVSEYYTSKLAEFGETAKGVDWNGEESQFLRFAQLGKIIKPEEFFTINDFGCGYGALYEYLTSQYNDFDYLGIDISEDMVIAAQKRYANKENAHFLHANQPDKIADYSMASGIFNVRFQHTDNEWLEYIKSTLDVLNAYSHKGFSFNCLTSYSDMDKMRDYLYYAQPEALFGHCKKNYASNIALLHDYGLYEFTILVRKCL